MSGDSRDIMGGASLGDIADDEEKALDEESTRPFDEPFKDANSDSRGSGINDYFINTKDTGKTPGDKRQENEDVPAEFTEESTQTPDKSKKGFSVTGGDENISPKTKPTDYKKYIKWALYAIGGIWLLKKLG